MRSLAISSCWGPSCWMPRFQSLASRSTTTLVWNANCAWPHVLWGLSRRKGILTSRPATPITTGSSWAASPIGSSRWPTARMPAITAVESAMRSRPRCGRVCPTGRTTNRRTVWRSARPEKTLLGRSSLIGRHTSRTSCGRFKRRKRRFTSPRIPTPRRLSPNGFLAKKSSTWATACGRTP